MQYSGSASQMDEIEWTDIPYILTLGVQSNGKTELGNDGKEQYYFIHKSTDDSDVSHTPNENLDDYAQNIFFCRHPPPYTVALVKKQPNGFLVPQIQLLQSAASIGLEPLSLSAPEIVEKFTTEVKKGRCYWI